MTLTISVKYKLRYKSKEMSAEERRAAVKRAVLRLFDEKLIAGETDAEIWEWDASVMVG